MVEIVSVFYQLYIQARGILTLSLNKVTFYDFEDVHDFTAKRTSSKIAQELAISNDVQSRATTRLRHVDYGR